MISSLAILLMGFFLAGSSMKTSFPSLAGETLSNYEGMVLEEGKTAAGKQKLFLRLENPLEDAESKTLKLYAIWSGEEQFQIGDIILLSGEILALNPKTIPGSYGEQLYLKTKGIDYKMFPEEAVKVGRSNGFNVVLQKQKEKVFDVFDTVLPARESGIVKAMATGERDDIDPQMQELYIKAGINHILCVSGLHISIFMLFIHFFVEKCLKKGKRSAALITIVFCMGFLVFTGFSPSSVRAVIMISVALFGRVIYRKSDMLNNLAIAAIVILLFQPLYLWNAGFQLSFITVIGIWMGLQQVSKEKGMQGKIKQSFILSLYASLFSYPIVAYHFFHISLIGIFVNLIILPFCSILLFFAFFTGVTGLIFPPLAAISAGGAYAVLKFYELVSLAAVSIPNSYVLVGAPSILFIGLYYLLLGLCSFYGKKFCNTKTVLCALAALGLSVFGNRLLLHKNTIAFLDVGQGDATVISTYDGKAIVVDGGGWFGTDIGKNTGVKVIQPYLEYLGIKEIEGIFLTHFDADHMLGVIELCDNVPTKGFYLSSYPYSDTKDWDTLKEILEKRQVMLYTVKEGDTTDWGGYGTISCLYPPENVKFTEKNDNHGSLVLSYTYQGITVLLTGDAAVEDERILLSEGMEVSADILKLGHHGSKNSSGSDFLEAVSPEVVIISCGKNNLYGHPHEETLERLVGVSVYRTDIQGTILAKLSPKGSYQIEAVGERESVYERIKEAMEKR